MFRWKRRSRRAEGDIEDADGVDGSCIGDDDKRPEGVKGRGLEGGIDEVWVDEQGNGRHYDRLNPSSFEGVTSVSDPENEREVPAVEDNASEDFRETPSTVPQSEERRRAVVEAVQWAWQVIRLPPFLTATAISQAVISFSPKEVCSF